ncbi:hypothetical protein QBC37DRAFT_433078 [Rhypophila decipiens]|uniref:Uncharacterized protein n=1 Tax=Rhypophila decipiens TaxID=261697 RepID=A0AAN6XVI3_9PEZI|nr:hypothetical protein QBC37DRAFT_433078 [Rhypophila decipiens]
MDALRHWSAYGQKGHPSSTRVTASQWKHNPFVQPKPVQWERTVPHASLTKLLNGFEPQAMEDKWFIYADGPDTEGNATVHMHRSWTGHKIVELKIKIPLTDAGEVKEEDAKITELIWESDKKAYNASEDDAKVTAQEVCRWVLHVELS